MKWLQRLKTRVTETAKDEVIKTVNADILPLAVSGLGALFTVWTLFSNPTTGGDVYNITYNTTINNYYGRIRK